MKRWLLRIWAALAALAALALCGWGWWAFAGRDGWTTGARLVAWTGPHGAALDAGSANRHGQSLVLIDGSRLWLVINAGDAVCPHGCLARIELQRAQGAVRWFMPAAAPIRGTRGLAIGPQRQLAIAYQDGGEAVQLALAGDAGWLSAPRRIAERGRVLGLRFAAEAVEVFIQPDLFELPERLRVDRAGEIERRLFAEPFAGADPPLIHAAYQPAGRDATWFYAGQGVAGGGLQAWRISSSGEREHLAQLDGQNMGLVVDFSAAGCVPVRRRTDYVLQASGRIVRRSPLPPAPGRAREPAFPSYQNVLVAEQGRLRRRARAMDAGVLVTRLAERELGLVIDPGGTLSGIGLVDLAHPGARVHKVLRTGRRCSSGFLVVEGPQSDWLVEPGGCYARLTEDLRRADPLDYDAHLTRHYYRPPPEAGPSAQRNLVFLWLWLLGLPALLLPAGLLGWWFARRRGSRGPWLLATAAACTLYLPLALRAIAALGNLMR